MSSESFLKEIQLLNEEKEKLQRKIQRVRHQNQKSGKIIDEMAKDIGSLKEGREKKFCDLKKRVLEFCQFR